MLDIVMFCYLNYILLTFILQKKKKERWKLGFLSVFKLQTKTKHATVFDYFSMLKSLIII